MRIQLCELKVLPLIWLVLLGVLPMGAAQNIVVNGSFELFNGTVPPPPWNGPFGMFLGISGAADGRNFASVSSPGDYAAQTLLTTPGQTYHLSFAVSGNSSFPGDSIALFKWHGAVAGTTTWTSPNTTGDGSHYNWTYGNFDLVATTSSTELRFERDPSSTSAGTFLDNIQVVPIPEPSALVCAFLFLCVAWARRRFWEPGRGASLASKG